LLAYLDRFVVGPLVSLEAVAYYATPYEIATKAWVIPGAVASVLFPAFAVGLRGDRATVSRMFSHGVNYIFLLLVPVTLLVVAFANDLLRVWLGAAFAANSTTVLQLIAIGVLI